ncbi:YegP family protein [Edwardsiella piscicida]|nr:YegP family protein [Edwardsiella piscicida]
MYASHASVENGILSVQTNAVEDAQYELCCEGSNPTFTQGQEPSGDRPQRALQLRKRRP